MAIDVELLEAVEFAGTALAPLFLEDPKTGGAGELVTAFAAIEPKSAAADWPFGAPDALEGAFARMTEGFADGHAEGSASAQVRAAGEGDVDAAGAVPEAGGEAPSPADIEALAWEYRRLFVGPQAKAAPPWGSVYTDHDRVAFGASERELRRWMRERGITLVADEGEPADHVGLMLSMMAWIAARKPEALCDFLRLHLLNWAPHFLELVERVAEHPFYAGLAALTRETLEGIRVALDLEVNYPRFYR